MNTRWLWIATLLLASSCSDVGYETRHSALAIEGPWTPDDEAAAEAESYDITFVSAGPWRGESGCSGNFTDGGQVLRQWLYDNWPQVTHVGGYSCRAINGDSISGTLLLCGPSGDKHARLITLTPTGRPTVQHHRDATSPPACPTS